MKRFQAVNLYLEEFRPREVIFSFYMMCVVVLGYLFLLVLVYFTTLNAGHQHQKQFAEMKQEGKAFDKKLASLRKLQTNTNTDSIVDRIQHLNTRKLELDKLVATLEMHSPDASTGFASQLLALGKHIPGDIALNEIEFNQGTGEVAFTGESENAESIPNYIASLSGDSVFSHSRFGMIVIYASEKEDFLQFKVGNAPEREEVYD